MTVHRVLQHHWVFFLVLILATIIRFHGLSTHMIFIGDQGRDFLVAKDMVEKESVPLLGIPSSIPRFKQGPLFIYFLAITYWISGGSVLATGVLAASFGIGAIVALYLLVYSYVGKSHAIVASLLFSFLPMMLLHARMPYHIVPIPLFVLIYFWQLMRWVRHERWSAFGVGFAFALVFQFELAAFPLVLMIPGVLLMNRPTLKMKVIWSSILGNWRRGVVVIGGILCGLIPQIIFDLTHGFSQLGGFLLWVGYKIVTAVLPFTHNSLTDGGSSAKIKDLITLFLSIFTQNGNRVDLFFWLLLLVASVIVSMAMWKKIPFFHTLIFFSCTLLSAGLVIHRVPSEAYMPLLAPGFVILIVLSLGQLPAKIALPIGCVIAASLVLSFVHLRQESYFLLNPQESNWSEKRFGPSIQTQEKIVDSLFTITGNRCIVLESLERDVTFPTLYNNLEYLIAIDSRGVGADCARIRIDRPEEAKRRWIDQGNVIDLGAYWIRVLDDQKVYAKAY